MAPLYLLCSPVLWGNSEDVDELLVHWWAGSLTAFAKLYEGTAKRVLDASVPLSAYLSSCLISPTICAFPGLVVAVVSSSTKLSPSSLFWTRCSGTAPTVAEVDQVALLACKLSESANWLEASEISMCFLRIPRMADMTFPENTNCGWGWAATKPTGCSSTASVRVRCTLILFGKTLGQYPRMNIGIAVSQWFFWQRNKEYSRNAHTCSQKTFTGRYIAASFLNFPKV